jgi:hypothetical protein
MQMAFLKPTGSVLVFQDSLAKPLVAPLWLYNSCEMVQQEGLAKSVKILKHFARVKKNCKLNLK